MKLLQKNCCGCSVKTGALVISYITLVQAVVPILNILGNALPEATAPDKIQTLNEYKRDLIWLGVVSIIIVAHALYAIYKRKPGYMVPFLIYKLGILFVLTIMLGFAPAIVIEMKNAFIIADRDEGDVLPCFIVTVLVFIAVESYSLLILFSHYQNLRHPPPIHAPTVGFSAAISDPEAAVPYAQPYCNEMPKKTPPPPYAV